LGGVASDRIICIGDSIEHDIAGAAGAGLSSCLVRTGILERSTEPELNEISEKYSAWPDFLMQRFVFG
jgi:ribonucleotide monophosphatase NagD (HAD superfamily)